MTHLADLYYRGELPAGSSPPDECIEVTLWEKFGWGPDQTEKLTLTKLRKIFAVLEQRRITNDKIENFGKPTQQRAEQIARTYAQQQAQSGLKVGQVSE